jgi:hypothetical protein
MDVWQLCFCDCEWNGNHFFQQWVLCTFGLLRSSFDLPFICVCVCVCARARACACLCVCVRMRVCACVCACVCVCSLRSKKACGGLEDIFSFTFMNNMHTILGCCLMSLKVKFFSVVCSCCELTGEQPNMFIIIFFLPGICNIHGCESNVHALL